MTEPEPPPEYGPLISVCVPARNEERNIGCCVEALLAQSYPNYEVIVLDDRSRDADTFVTPEALAAVYAKAAETEADLFTIMTHQVMLTFWERAVLPLVMLTLSVGFSPRKVNDPERKDAIANGQFILIKRAVYEAIGGHATIKGSIVEDKDLAVLVKRNGYHLVVADGRQGAYTRMYTSLPEMWEVGRKISTSVCATTGGCSCWAFSGRS
jgi:chlorobactene glucosyltransferase